MVRCSTRRVRLACRMAGSACSAVVATLILWACHRLIGLRADEEGARFGLDLAARRLKALASNRRMAC